MVANIAGPVCETGDMFGIDRPIDHVGRGDLAVFHATGAYGAAMASSYNSRPVSPQVMVDGEAFELVGDRILPSDLPTRSEHRPWTLCRAVDAALTQAA
jgi:diaminopimelate decarboxylase